MDHEDIHCFDFTDKCPEDCFRARNERDLDSETNDIEPRFLTYMHLKGTKECKLKGDNDESDEYRSEDQVDIQRD